MEDRVPEVQTMSLMVVQTQSDGAEPLAALSGFSVAVRRDPRGFFPRNHSVRVTLHGQYIFLSAGEHRAESPG